MLENHKAIMPLCPEARVSQYQNRPYLFCEVIQFARVEINFIIEWAERNGKRKNTG
ncbi:hypothetical protein HHI36_000729, partial [Cryptolaemus montrouzieri]